MWPLRKKVWKIWEKTPNKAKIVSQMTIFQRFANTNFLKTFWEKSVQIQDFSKMFMASKVFQKKTFYEPKICSVVL